MAARTMASAVAGAGAAGAGATVIAMAARASAKASATRIATHLPTTPDVTAIQMNRARWPGLATSNRPARPRANSTARLPRAKIWPAAATKLPDRATTAAIRIAGGAGAGGAADAGAGAVAREIIRAASTGSVPRM